MFKFELVFVLLCCYLAAYFVSSDCGCNNLKRTEKSQNVKERKTLLDSDNKVCEQTARKNNKHYRDYYGETTMENEVNDKQHEDEPQIAGMSLIPGGNYFIGTNEPHFKEDREHPERAVHLKDFYIDKYELSNAKFLEFVKATNYTTEAENFGDSFLFKDLLSEEMREKYADFRVVNALWWYKVSNVNWQHPNGPESNLDGLWQHPVVHVSWNDAQACCKWANKRLPTEAEWEVACRGGRQRKLYPWGNKLMPNNEHWLNIWQGEFPDKNTLEDGFATTCPVDKFRQNIYNLYNMVGNVWEWTEDVWSAQNDKDTGHVKKGGSYLCNKSYCYRYRCAARSHNTADSSAGNLGFRCAKDLE